MTQIASENTTVTARTKMTRVPKRASYNRQTIYKIFDEAFVCHVGVEVSGSVRVIPMAHWRQGNQLYLHGSTKSPLMAALAQGAQASITATILDGLVLARSAFHHSMNYRSAMVYGCARLVDEPEEKWESLAQFVNHIVPGRWDEVRQPDAKELKATMVLAFDLEEASAKIRTGPPVDDEADYALAVWAGEVPLSLAAKDATPDTRLADATSVPVLNPIHETNRTP